MKNRFISLLVLSSVISCSYAVYATIPNKLEIHKEALDTPPGEKIILLGTLMYGINPNAIEASVTDDAVYIQFNQSFGSVNIAILNGNGVQVYGTVVDTSIQQLVIIPFSNVASDTYTVVLNKADNYAEGDFERE